MFALPGFDSKVGRLQGFEASSISNRANACRNWPVAVQSQAKQ